MLNQYAVDNPTLPVNLRFSHLFKILAEMLCRSGRMPSRNDGPRSIWDTVWYIGKRFLQIQQRLLQHLIRKGSILGMLICQNIHHRM